MALEKDNNHVAEALALFIEQFKNKENLSKFMTAFINQIQDLENANWDLLTNRAMDTAIGVQLDGLGEIVGEERNGRSDDEYRIALQTRISINLASGTPEEIIAILAAIITNDFQLTEYYPAAFSITVDDALTDDLNSVFTAIKQIKPAGVKVGFEYTLNDDADTFTFASGDTVEASTSQGWSDDAQTTGGSWADVESV